MNIPTVENVARIANISDPVIRNLNITPGYYELSQAMSKYTDGNPNWCTFAVWASKQDIQSIRKDDLSRTFEQLFHQSPVITLLLNTLSQHSDVIKNLPEVKAISGFILKALNPDASFEHSAQSVAEGNKKVFAEFKLIEGKHLFFIGSMGVARIFDADLGGATTSLIGGEIFPRQAIEADRNVIEDIRAHVVASRFER